MNLQQISPSWPNFAIHSSQKRAMNTAYHRAVLRLSQWRKHWRFGQRRRSPCKFEIRTKNSPVQKHHWNYSCSFNYKLISYCSTGFLYIYIYLDLLDMLKFLPFGRIWKGTTFTHLGRSRSQVLSFRGAALRPHVQRSTWIMDQTLHVLLGKKGWTRCARWHVTFFRAT